MITSKAFDTSDFRVSTGIFFGISGNLRRKTFGFPTVNIRSKRKRATFTKTLSKQNLDSPGLKVKNPFFCDFLHQSNPKGRSSGFSGTNPEDLRICYFFRGILFRIFYLDWKFPKGFRALFQCVVQIILFPQPRFPANNGISWNLS